MEELAWLAGIAVAAALAGYLVSFAIDWLLLKRLIQDRVSGIVLSCALTFVILMGGTTAYLTWTSPFDYRPIIVPPFGQALAFIAALAMVATIRVRRYAYEYEHNEDQAVFDPDLDDQSLYDEQVLRFDERHGHRNYFYRHWVGHLPLPLSYWINGGLLSALILAGGEAIAYRIETSGGSLRILSAISLLFLVVSLLVWVWSSVGIWRSATWHRRRGGSALWGNLARVVMALGLVTFAVRSSGFALEARELGSLAMGTDPLGKYADMSISRDREKLILRGVLAQGASDRFAELLKSNPNVREIVLTSEGGRILEGERIGARIRERHLNTRVDDYCMSACISVLIAGRERTAPNMARIGFHQPSFPGLNAQQMSGATEHMRQEYLAAGIDPVFAWRALVTPAASMWFPTADELVAANVITGSDIVITGASAGRKSGKEQPEEESLSEKRLRSELQLAAADINRLAPRQLDSLTRLEGASASGFTLTRRFILKADNLDIPRSRAAIGELVERETCAIPAMAAAVRDGARFVSSYKSTHGRHLFDVTITSCTA